MSEIASHSSSGMSQAKLGSPVGEERLVIHRAQQFAAFVKRVVDVDHQRLAVAELERLLDGGREFAVGDQTLVSAWPEDEGDGARVEPVVERVQHRRPPWPRRNAPRACAGTLGAITDTVSPLPTPRLRKRVGQGAAAGVKFGIGETPLAVDDRDFLGIDRGRAGEKATAATGRVIGRARAPDGSRRRCPISIPSPALTLSASRTGSSRAIMHSCASTSSPTSSAPGASSASAGSRPRWRSARASPPTSPGGPSSSIPTCRRAAWRAPIISPPNSAAAPTRNASTRPSSTPATRSASPSPSTGSTRTPNTLDAHRLIRFADSHGAANEVVDRLFSGLFHRGPGYRRPRHPGRDRRRIRARRGRGDEISRRRQPARRGAGRRRAARAASASTRCRASSSPGNTPSPARRSRNSSCRSSTWCRTAATRSARAAAAGGGLRLTARAAASRPAAISCNCANRLSMPFTRSRSASQSRMTTRR